jgi:hypothetical protein
MHFSQAVPAGEALCSGLGKKVAEKANKLKSGDKDGAMVDYDDRSIHVKAKKYGKETKSTKKSSRLRF